MQIYKANFENGPKQGNPYPYEMWQNYQQSLILYGCACYKEWQRRFIDGERGGKLKHKSGEEFTALRALLILDKIHQKEIVQPPWLTESFASNHRSILLGKATEGYLIISKQLAEHTSTNPTKAWVREHNKLTRKVQKAEDVLDWYQSHGWIEQPAEKVNNKWPYIWPEMER